jgi:predicted O-linked N-acetylglucosamine transferase (SPINDLY family)
MSGDKENLEPYSEQVVLLDGQAISFPHNEQHNPRQDRRFAAGDATTVVSASINTGEIHFDEYGIPSGDNISVYMCFQNLFKIHPKFDIILMRILIADMNGHVVLQAARDHQHTNSVKGRIIDLVKSELCPKPQKDACQEAQNILSRIHFIPRVMSFDMKKVFQRSTVAIHPFPFGGSKTASDILGSGVPLVIYPQEYLRGRYMPDQMMKIVLFSI